MKLSEAIRIGAMMRPQEFGGYITPNGSCALGAAMEASCVRLGDVEAAFPVLRTYLYSSWNDHTRMMLRDMVITLNDCYCWSREEIANMVEVVERAVEGGTPVPCFTIDVTRMRVEFKVEKPEPVLV